MSDTFVGQILLLPSNFPPKGFAFCWGQLLPISQNTALFSLLGTMYGGDGKSTFALPDLRGRVALSFGQGPGLSTYTQGQSGGTETITLVAAQLPSHTHALTNGLTATARGKNGTANQRTPAGNVPAVEASQVTATYRNTAPDANAAAGAVVLGGSVTAAAAGGSQPHDNRQPYLTLNFCIALQGIFPARS